MNLKNRIEKLTGGAKAPSAGAARPEIADLRSRLESVMGRRRVPAALRMEWEGGHTVALEHAVGGEEAVTSHGRFFFSRSSIAGFEYHGKRTVSDLCRIDMTGIGILSGDTSLAHLRPEDALFIDTETTGLSGGTGTFPFLVGLGWFEKGAFAVCQLFARDFSEERAMLAHLCEIASEKRFLVSFNGKAFDLNLLGARFVLNRLVDTLSSMPHLDLLHPGRRLLRHRVKDARLSTIETQVLGVERGRDIEGREIPLRYFEWLKRRDGSLMAEVFRHNRVDVASMASLLKHLVDLVCGGGERVRSHDCDALAAAALLESRGESGRASVLYEAALASCDPFVRRNALAALSGIHKRAGRWETAAALWREMLDADPVDVFAAEELAKYHEHLRREYAAARDIVRSILETCAGLSNAKRLELEHRLRRLELKGGLNRCNRGSHDDNKKHSS